MHDTPRADDLLMTARAALLDELLPKLPPETHYTARMIAHAMGIAARESRAAPMADALRAELAALAGVARDTPAHDVADALADRLRAGAFDDDRPLRARLHAALVAWTAERVLVDDARAGASTASARSSA
jgi:hypothetical protein